MSKMISGVAKIPSREALVAALEEMGFIVEVHNTPVNLRGYTGDTRPEVANVVIRRPTRSSNDVGWLELEDGSWEEIISKYDRGGVLGRVVNAKGKFAEHVVAHAMKHHAIEQCVEAGYSYEIEEEDDILRVTAYA